MSDEDDTFRILQRRIPIEDMRRALFIRRMMVLGGLRDYPEDEVLTTGGWTRDEWDRANRG